VAEHGTRNLTGLKRYLSDLRQSFSELRFEVHDNSGEPLPDPADEALRRFRNLGSAYIGFALADSGLFHASFVNHSPYCKVETIPANVEEQIAASRPYQILADSLDELVRVGILDAARREMAPIATWSAVHGLSTLLLDGPLAGLAEPERAEAIRRTLDILVDGVRCSYREALDLASTDTERGYLAGAEAS
jgi:hypothetical protein